MYIFFCNKGIIKQVLRYPFDTGRNKIRLRKEGEVGRYLFSHGANKIIKVRDASEDVPF